MTENNEMDKVSQEMRNSTEELNRRIDEFNATFGNQNSDAVQRRMSRLTENGFLDNEAPKSMVEPMQETPQEPARNDTQSIDDVVSMFENSANVTKEQNDELLAEYLSTFGPVTPNEETETKKDDVQEKKVEITPVEEVEDIHEIPVEEELTEDEVVEDKPAEDNSEEKLNVPEDLPVEDDTEIEEVKEPKDEKPKIIEEDCVAPNNSEELKRVGDALIELGNALKALAEKQ